MEKLLQRGLKYADDIEMYHSKSRVSSVKGESKNLKGMTCIDQGWGVRAQVDGKIGFSFTTRADGIEECVRKAASIARTKKDTADLEFPCNPLIHVDDLYCRKTAHLSIEEIVSYLNEVLENKGDTTSLEGALEIREMERAVFNSSGLEATEKGTFADLSVLARGECLVSEDRSSRSFHNLDGHELVEDLTRRSRSAPTGTLSEDIDTIILSPEAVSLLFSILLCPAFCADNVLDNQSFLGNLRDEMVACEDLTITDDATVGGGLVSRSFDAEGVSSRQVPLIEEGRLVGYLHNLSTGGSTGGESTGNAFRDYRNEPIVFPSNLIIEHAIELELDELLNGKGKAVMARGIVGAYSSDYITGDYSITLDECSLIQNGMAERIENISIGGNALDLLKSIQAVSRERVQCGHFISPSIAISSFHI
jgi:PmbA protein